MVGWIKWFVAALLALLIVVAVWYYAGSTPPSPGPTTASTKLELEAVGGFAYIHAPGDQEVNVAFLGNTVSTELDSTGKPVCEVPQLGVDLIVISGTITSFASNPPKPIPADHTFNLKGAVVTFPDLANSSKPLVVARGDRPPTPGPWGPPDPNNAGHWADVKWVPGIRYAAGSGGRVPDYPSSSLDPNWRTSTKVDGRVVLTHVEVHARNPSDVVAKDTVFQFKTSSGSKTPYKQAITDATRFSGDVPADQVVINLTGSAFGFGQIIVKPTTPGRPVKLKLLGRHNHQTPSDLPIGSPIKDYCAFYQLLQPVPPAIDQLIPHIFSGPTGSAGGGQPSPGAYCGGEWYPE